MGSSRTKVGFSGNENPFFLIPTPSNIYQTKTVKNISLMEKFFIDVFTDYLSIDPKEKSFVLSESVFEEKN